MIYTYYVLYQEWYYQYMFHIYHLPILFSSPNIVVIILEMEHT